MSEVQRSERNLVSRTQDDRQISVTTLMDRSVTPRAELKGCFTEELKAS